MLQPDWYRDSHARWGARWVRCALQVNPYEYVVRHATPTIADEASYNDQLVKALVAAGVELIAITDHYRVKSSQGLADAARASNITVLPGFEASTFGRCTFLVHLRCPV